MKSRKKESQEYNVNRWVRLVSSALAEGIYGYYFPTAKSKSNILYRWKEIPEVEMADQHPWLLVVDGRGMLRNNLENGDGLSGQYFLMNWSILFTFVETLSEVVKNQNWSVATHGAFGSSFF